MVLVPSKPGRVTRQINNRKKKVLLLSGCRWEGKGSTKSFIDLSWRQNWPWITEVPPDSKVRLLVLDPGFCCTISSSLRISLNSYNMLCIIVSATYKHTTYPCYAVSPSSLDLSASFRGKTLSWRKERFECFHTKKAFLKPSTLMITV